MASGTGSWTDTYQYYVTAIPGLEHFAMDELRSKLSATHVVLSPAPGKVLFTCDRSRSLTQLRSLLSVEHVYLLVAFIPYKDLGLDEVGVAVPTATDTPSTGTGPVTATAGGTVSYDRLTKIVSQMEWERLIRVWETNVFDARPLTATAATTATASPLPVNGTAAPIAVVDASNGGGSSSGIAPAPIKFRVRCTRGGERTKHLHSQKISAAIGAHVFDRMKSDRLDRSDRDGRDSSDRKQKQQKQSQRQFVVDLSNAADLDITCLINDQFLLIGLPVTDTRLSDRSYTVHSTLRSSVAYCFGLIANLQPAQTVCDPMCGRGALLIEAARHIQPNALYFASDIDHKQLEMCAANIRAAGLTGLTVCEPLLADATCLPYMNGSMDCILTDIPFGLAHGSTHYNKVLYPKLLTEFYRIVRVGGCAIVLTSRSQERTLHLALANQKLWTCVRTFSIKLGDIKSHVAILIKPKPAGSGGRGGSGGSGGVSHSLNLHLLRNDIEQRAAIKRSKQIAAASTTAATATATATTTATTGSNVMTSVAPTSASPALVSPPDTKSPPAAKDSKVNAPVTAEATATATASTADSVRVRKTPAQVKAQREAGEKLRAERSLKRQAKAAAMAKAAGLSSDAIAAAVAAAAPVPVLKPKHAGHRKQTRAPPTNKK